MLTGDAGATDPVCTKSPNHALIDAALAEAARPAQAPLIFRDVRHSARLGRAF
jgi:pyrroloquinoline quinone biosynthesis protein E